MVAKPLHLLQSRVSFASTMLGLVLLAALPADAVARCANPVNEGFESKKLDAQLWYDGQLVPKEYDFEGKIVDQGKWSFAISGLKPDIQRNEVRLLPECQPSFGTGSWYAFSFHLVGDIPPSGSIRHVVGQWKESTGGSPFVAQRLDNKIFHISVETEVATPAGPRECRVIVAKAPGDIYVMRLLDVSPMQRDAISECSDLDLDKDLHITVERHVDPCPGEAADGPACLPDPFSGWVPMRYYVQGRTDGMIPPGGGVLEVWVGDTKVVTVRGALGHLSRASDEQYFKIGVYRDVPGTSDAEKQVVLDALVADAEQRGEALSRFIVYFDSFRHGLAP